ncbi:hypothetical protein [Nocardia sp. NPDC058114]
MLTPAATAIRLVEVSAIPRSPNSSGAASRIWFPVALARSCVG